MFIFIRAFYHITQLFVEGHAKLTIPSSGVCMSITPRFTVYMWYLVPLSVQEHRALF
jgi:hypothetical protein